MVTPLTGVRFKVTAGWGRAVQRLTTKCTCLALVGGGAYNFNDRADRGAFKHQYLFIINRAACVNPLVFGLRKNLRNVGHHAPVAGCCDLYFAKCLRNIKQYGAVNVGPGKIKVGAAEYICDFTAFKIFGDDALLHAAKNSNGI